MKVWKIFRHGERSVTQNEEQRTKPEADVLNNKDMKRDIFLKGVPFFKKE
jgi:hypothetical protein